MINNVSLNFHQQPHLRRRAVLGVTIGAGVYSALQLPIDAVPDITNKQVQINTVAPALAPAGNRAADYFPAGSYALAGMPRLKETRSISQFGLSQVTVIFEDERGHLFRAPTGAGAASSARKTVAAERCAAGDGAGLDGPGRDFYTVIEARKTPMEKRTILDGIVRPQLRTVPGHQRSEHLWRRREAVSGHG